MNDQFLQAKLNQRKEEHSLRELRIGQEGMIDFCSNDYLGIVRNGLLNEADQANYPAGSTGSRLLTGNSVIAQETEDLIAGFHRGAAALLFNSGYDANVGLLASVPQKGDTILYDQYSHASLRDGIRLSFAAAHSFAHNDIEALEKKLKSTTGRVFVVTESIFSMDGDTCPLVKMVECCKQYGAFLMLDEAHATGVTGENGEGLAQSLGLEQELFARVHTFGKACGSHGAAVVGSATLIKYLVNFARPFIYSTALPARAIAPIRTAYELFPHMKSERARLDQLIGEFRKQLSMRRWKARQFIDSHTPIQGVLVPGNDEARKVAHHLHANGLDCRPILYPTVPRGGERLRIVLHSFNTGNELTKLLNCLENS